MPSEQISHVDQGSAQFDQCKTNILAAGFNVDHIQQTIREFEHPTSEIDERYLQMYTSQLTGEELYALMVAYNPNPDIRNQTFYETLPPDIPADGIRNVQTTLYQLRSQVNISHNTIKPFDIHKKAESLLLKFQLNKDETLLTQIMNEINSKTTHAERYAQLDTLKSYVAEIVKKYSITFRYGYFGAEVEFPDSELGGEVYALDTAQDVIISLDEREDFEKRLNQLGPIDQERYNALKLQYGAKAATLLILNEMKNDVNDLWEDGRERLRIPEFRALPVDVYRKWMRGENVDTQLQEIYEWSKTVKDEHGFGPIIVRSSAVFSEDNKEDTGAGIYTSSVIEADVPTYEEFKKVVEKVYTSTSSSEALRHQATMGIDHEEMGVIVQRLVVSTEVYHPVGEANSQLPGVPGLMEVASTYSRNYVNRNMLDKLIAQPNDSVLEDAHHFSHDSMVVAGSAISRVAQLTYVFEKIFGHNVQVEFADEAGGLCILQVRPQSPDAFYGIEPLFFPSDLTDEFAGSGVGIGDVTLGILHNNDTNKDSSGIVVVEDNNMWGYQHKLDCLPKEGAVVILGKGGERGHIITHCATRGLLCVYPAENGESYQGKILRRYEEGNFKANERLRVVSNGMEGRVYLAEDEDLN